MSVHGSPPDHLSGRDHVTMHAYRITPHTAGVTQNRNLVFTLVASNMYSPGMSVVGAPISSVMGPYRV